LQEFIHSFYFFIKRKFFGLPFFQNISCKVFATLLFLTPSSHLFANGLGDGSDGSPNISGVINIYTSVVSIAPSTCSSTITVLSSAGFAAGDLVLIIQMENATVNTTNTPSYGSILSYNNCGNFEYAKIFSVAGTSIQTIAPLVNNYDILGVVQLVKVPQYINPTITGTLTCLPWNGVTGGVIALDATGTITMNADIDASKKGFRGGQYKAALDIPVHLGDYLALDTDSFCLKGEGIAHYNIEPNISGRGAAANGGGGGNNHNGGGGGGSNWGCGGNGGYGMSLPSYGNYIIAQGMGGYPLNSAVSNRVFMGGGGGAGNSDNGSIASGGNGGGIILISANFINGNSKFVSSYGDSSATTYIDGVGGAGAGGTIIINCSNVNSNLKLDVHGGNGGNVTSPWSDAHGPGGGGGGGLIGFTIASIPANVSISSMAGGSSGLFNSTLPHGSTSGCSGTTLLNFTLPKQLINPTTITSKDTSFCDNGSLTLNATTGTTYSWSPVAGLSCSNCQSPVATVNSTTIYIATVAFSSCIYIDTFNILIRPLPNVMLTSFSDVCEDASSFLLNGGGPAGGIYSGTGVVANTFDPAIAGVGIDSITYSYSDAYGCANSKTKSIIVNALPALTFNPIDSICDGSAAFALTTGIPAGGTYSGVGVLGNNFDPAVAGIGTQAITYSYTDAQGCSNSTTTNITVNALPNVSLSNFNSVCADAPSFFLSGGSPAGGTYWGTGVNANNFDPAIAGVGSHAITYSFTDANGCSNSKTKNTTVNALPTVTLSAINAVCIASSAFALTTGTPSGGTYSGIGVTGNSFTPSTAGIGTHTIYYSFTDVNGCSNIDSNTITVYDIPVVTFTPVNPVCDGTSAFALSGGTPAGGTYSGVGVVGNNFDPAVAGIGTQTVNYFYTDIHGCANSTTTNITVNALPNVSLSNFTPVCADASFFALSGGTPTGGTYSGAGVSANDFDPAIAGVGSHAITYSFTDANGCSNSKTKNITVNALPTVTLSAINPVCIASSAFTLTTGTPSGGSYSGIGVTGNSFTPSTAGIGTHKIYYSFADTNSCSNIDSTTITVYDIPVVTFTPVNPVCDGTSAFALTGGSPAGGTYSGVGVVGNNFDPAAAGIGTQTITYSYTDAQGCSNSTTTNITVNALPNITLSNFSSVCVDASSFALSGGSPAGGMYSGTGVNANNFDPATAGVGIHAIIYSYTDANGCSNTKTKNIIVNALPTVTLWAINPVCIASSAFALTTGTPSGGTYSGIGVTGNNFTPSTAGIGTHTIYYSFTDVNGCSNIDSTTITVYDIPVVTFTPVIPVCDGTPAFALTGGSPVGGIYSGVGVVGNNFDPAVAGIGTQNITYTYTDAQGCSNSTTTNISVNALPNVTLSNFSFVCVDASTFALSGGSPAGGTYSGTGVNANNFDPATAGVGSHTITYSFTDANGCSNSKTKNITVNALPTVTLSVINPVCIASSAFTLTTGTPSGGTYSGIGVTGNSFTPFTAGIGTHTIYYSFADGNGCSNIDSTAITVYNIPVVTFTPVNPVCVGTSAFALSGGTPAGGTYSGLGVVGNNFDPAVAGIGTQTITYSYTDAQGCSNSTITNITVNALPNVTLSNFSSVCVDASSFALSGGSPTGGTYSGTGVNANNFDPAIAGVGSHPITYSFTDANSCMNSAAKNLTVNPLIFLNAGSDETICSGYNIQLNATGSSIIDWTPSAGLSCTNCFNPVASPLTSVNYVVSSPLPCSTNDTVEVAVLPAVVVNAGNDTLLCFGEQLQLNAVSNYADYNWNATNELSCLNCPDPVLSPSATSFYTVTSSNGVCNSSDSLLVKVIKVDVEAGNDMAIAFGETIHLNATGADTYLWSPGIYLNDSTIQSPISSPYSSIQYTVVGNIDRCSDSDTVSIEVIYIGDAIFVPNAFTPDADGKNDFFGAIHAGKYDSFEMKIFNRWGEMLFNSDNISQFWDGTSKGIKQPTGVYVYSIHLTAGKNKINKTGNVSLIR
jgi:gliding motility-associated-like protein